MGDISKSVIFDAAKQKPRQWNITVGLERRTEKAPNGTVERWVDNQGNVVFAQLLQPAALRRDPTHVDAARAKLQRKGWIPHARCPLTVGSLSVEDFPAELRQICPTGSYGPGRPCGHVQHVISIRQAEQTAKMKQLEDAFFASQRAREKVEQDKLAATERLNERLAQVVETALADRAPAAGKKAKAKDDTE
jgi:hypothetical protein